MPKSERTMPASQFKAQCLRVLDDVAARRVSKVTVTKRGKPTAIVTAAERPLKPKKPFAHGFLKGSVMFPEGLDLTAPVLDEPFDAGSGILHR